jgi:hypothetical protein
MQGSDIRDKAGFAIDLVAAKSVCASGNFKQQNACIGLKFKSHKPIGSNCDPKRHTLDPNNNTS